MISLTISHYHVLEKLLGGGGMGVVSEPEDLSSAATSALKVPPRKETDDRYSIT